MITDSYLVMVATTKSRKMSYCTYRAAKIVSLCVWSFDTVIILPFTVFAKTYKKQGRSQHVFVFPQPESMWWKSGPSYTLILGFAIPVSTICILCTTMLCRLRHVHLHCNAKALDKAKKKVRLMVIVILSVCLFCWMPCHLSTVVTLITDIPQTPFIIGIFYFVTSLSYANSCFSPFLYAFLEDSFQRSFRKLIDCRTTS